MTKLEINSKNGMTLNVENGHSKMLFLNGDAKSRYNEKYNVNVM